MKLIKMRKVYRIFFPKKYTLNELFENKLRYNSIVQSFEKKGQLYEIKLYGGIKLKMRDENHSDYLVFEQIFNFKEYQVVLKMMQLSNFNGKQKIIIDAGANVGYTTVFLAQGLQDTKIYAVEPSIENAGMFIENISDINNIKLYQKSLSHKKGILYTIDRKFRDGKDWSITTIPDPKGDISGISIDEIIKDNKLDYISLLKIDLEGAERFIFNLENDLTFLKITQILVLEIHDEFDIRDIIYTILKANNFLLIEAGESLIAVNKSFSNW